MNRQLIVLSLRLAWGAVRSVTAREVRAGISVRAKRTLTGLCAGVIAGWVCAVAAGQPAEEFETDVFWRFRLDPEDAGWLETWQALTLTQTEAWARIRTDDCWEKQAEGGHLREATRERIKAYDEISWYATSLDIPSRLKGRPLFLRFGAVDESAWVYVNGHLAGQHVFVREDDWEKPFDIRADPFVDWARPTHVVVRVEDQNGQGGDMETCPAGCAGDR